MEKNHKTIEATMTKKRALVPGPYSGVTCPTQEQIIKAACEAFSITEDTLISDRSHYTAYIRWVCFYLIKKHTHLNEKFIGNRFFLVRRAVLHGIETIEVRLKVYGQTRTDIANVMKLAGISP